MSAERLREMLSEATPGPWMGGSYYREGAPNNLKFEVMDGAANYIVGTSMNETDARLIALAPDAIALLTDAQDALTALTSYDFHATQHIDGLTHDGHALRALHTEDVDALIRDVTAGREVLDRLDALCGDERA